MRKKSIVSRHAVSTVLRAGRAFIRPETPILAQLVVIRRCNLSCTYCTEYDDHSPPVPVEQLLARVDHIATLGTLVLTLTGGEPFLHPELDTVAARAREHGMVVTSISNAYPITRKWIERMNRAGLSLLQVSVDNIEPNEVSQKSWSKIRKKLMLLRDHAAFNVNVNAVLGSSPQDQTRELVKKIRELGFYMTVGMLHDDKGQIDTGLIGKSLPEFYDEIRALCHKSAFHGFGEGWEDKMLRNEESSWRCRAGARYLYVDEFGKVNYCSQRMGEPGVGVLEYTRDHLREAFDRPKGCESRCTVACVRRASSLDEWRPQKGPTIHPRRHLETL